MKKFFVILIALISLLLILARIGNYLNKKVISSKQVVFKVYLDIDKEEIDDFFSLEKGIYDKEKMRVICSVPVSLNDFERPVYQNVYFKNNIDCDEEYVKGKHTRYEFSQLKNNNMFELLLVNNRHTPVMFYQEWSDGKAIARFPFRYNYKKGKINQIVISKNGVSDYCE